MSDTSPGALLNQKIRYQHLAGIFCLFDCITNTNFRGINLEGIDSEDFELHFSKIMKFCQAKSKNKMEVNEIKLIIDHFLGCSTRSATGEGSFLLISDRDFNTEGGERIKYLLRKVRNGSHPILHRKLVQILDKDYEYSFLSRIQIQIKSKRDLEYAIKGEMYKHLNTKIHPDDLEFEFYSLLGEFLHRASEMRGFTAREFQGRLNHMNTKYVELDRSQSQYGKQLEQNLEIVMKKIDMVLMRQEEQKLPTLPIDNSMVEE